MANILSNFAKNITKTLIDDIQRKRTNWYYVLGGVNSDQITALSRGISADSLSPAEENVIRSELVYYNKVQPGSVSRTIYRQDWIAPIQIAGGYISTSGIKFQNWCDRLASTDFKPSQPYYCGIMRDDDQLYDIYVCLDYGVDQNLLDGTPPAPGTITSTGCRISVISPSGRSVGPMFYDPNAVYNKLTGAYVRPYVDSTSILSPFVEERGDGYTWKYMSSVSYSKMKKFADGLHVPVALGTNDIVNNGGAISDLMVINGGSGYTNNSRCNIVITSPRSAYLTHTTDNPTDPTVAVVNTTGQLNSEGGFIPSSFNIVNGGSGYLNSSTSIPATVNITNSSGGLSTGYGAQLSVITSGGVVTGIQINEPGVGYSTTDIISITTGGCQFSVQVSINPYTVPGSDDQEIGAGSIQLVTVDNPGAGVIAPPQLSVSYVPVIGSTSTPAGAYGNPSAVLNANIGGGEVQSVTIVDPGQGYPFDQSTYLVAVGDGSGAQFSPIVSPSGQIIDVIVDNPGSGYSQMVVQAYTSSTTYTPAVFEAMINTGEFSVETQTQSSVEQLAIVGGLHSVDYNGRCSADRNDYVGSTPMTGLPYTYTPGTGYTTGNSTVVITGDGIGATAVVGHYTPSGGIGSIVITNPGIGYTFANGSIIDTNPSSPGHTAPGSACSFRFNIPPVGGHGANILNELNSTGLSVYSTFMGDSVLANLDKTYSIVGLVRSPIDNTGVLLNSLYSIPSIAVTVDNPTAFVENEALVINASAIAPNLYFRVLDISGPTLTLLPLTIANSSYSISGSLNSLYTGNSANVLSVTYQQQYVNRNSGDLVFYNNTIAPISFSYSTGVALKTYIDLTSMYCQMTPLASNYNGSWYAGNTNALVTPPVTPPVMPH